MTNDLIKNAIITFYSFYDHNALVFYLVIALIFVAIRLFLKPSRYYVLLIIGLLMLIFSFEYQKHLIPHFFSHLLDPIVDPKTHARTYRYSSLFLSRILPVLLDFTGWFLMIFSLFFTEKLIGEPSKNPESNQESKILKLKSDKRE